jgi:hypothetical protein
MYTVRLINTFIAMAFFALVTAVVAPSMGDNQRCQVVFSATKRSWTEINSLVFMTYNVANIYGLRGKFQRISATDFVPIYEKPPRPKPEEQVQQLRNIMNEIDADVAILTEVESLAALRTLSTEITSSYKSFLVEGNDMRGIDIGFLIKSDLPIKGEIFSHKNREWKDPVTRRKTPLFSRDLPVLLLRKDNEIKPFLMIFGMHAISMRGRPGDFQSARLRAAQFEGALGIISEFREKYGHDIPVMLAGDFNTSVMFAPEAQPIRGSLASAFDLAQETIPRAARVTHTFHEDYIDTADHATYERTSMDQLDDIRLLGVLPQSVITARVHRYRDAEGFVLPFAISREMRYQQNSDHLPVVVEISRDAFEESAN